MNLKKALKFLKSLYRFAIDNYFISIFLACIAFVGFVSVYKMFFVKPTYVYVKVKMGQGLWWASTQRPPMWFVKNLKAGVEEKGLTGEPSAKILSLHYYPWWESNQYDVYLIMKLRVTGSKKTGRYNFKRSSIGVGAPVDFEFPSLQFSGTIIEISKKPIKENLITKTIILTKKWAFPWEYDAIQIGDKYFDGQDTVFTIIDKTAKDVYAEYSSYGNNYPIESEVKKNITVKAKIKLQKTYNLFVFGNEQLIGLGKTINIATDNFTFTDYLVTEIE